MELSNHSGSSTPADPQRGAADAAGPRQCSAAVGGRWRRRHGAGAVAGGKWEADGGAGTLDHGHFHGFLLANQTAREWNKIDNGIIWNNYSWNDSDL